MSRHCERVQQAVGNVSVRRRVRICCLSLVVLAPIRGQFCNCAAGIFWVVVLHHQEFEMFVILMDKTAAAIKRILGPSELCIFFEEANCW